jgi:hypothetical protein
MRTSRFTGSRESEASRSECENNVFSVSLANLVDVYSFFRSNDLKQLGGSGMAEACFRT